MKRLSFGNPASEIRLTPRAKGQSSRARMNADAELDAALRRQAGVAFRHAALRLEGGRRPNLSVYAAAGDNPHFWRATVASAEFGSLNSHPVSR